MLLMLLATSLACSACDRRDRDVPEPYRSMAVPAKRLHDPAAQARGAALFAETCALCHGPRGDGRGVRQSGLARPPRDLRDPGWRERTSPRRVFWVIREGVPAGGMPAWKAFDDAETWDLVAYVLSLAPGAS